MNRLHCVGDAVYCPGVVRPGSVLEKFVLELSGPKKKKPKFSCNKFHFFPKKIFVLEVSSSFLFVRENCLNLGFLGEV